MSTTHPLAALDWLLDVDEPPPKPALSAQQRLAVENALLRTLAMYLYRSVSTRQWDAACARTCQMQDAGDALAAFLAQRT